MKNIINCICESKDIVSNIDKVVSCDISYKAKDRNIDCKMIEDGIEWRAKNDFSTMINMAKSMGHKVESVKFTMSHVDQKSDVSTVEAVIDGDVLIVSSKDKKLSATLNSEKIDLTDKEKNTLQENIYFVPVIMADVVKRVL